jgi:hypothetical protein
LTRTPGKSLYLKKSKSFYITESKAAWGIVLLNTGTKRKDFEFSNEEGYIQKNNSMYYCILNFSF